MRMKFHEILREMIGKKEMLDNSDAINEMNRLLSRLDILNAENDSLK